MPASGVRTVRGTRRITFDGRLTLAGTRVDAFTITTDTCPYLLKARFTASLTIAGVSGTGDQYSAKLAALLAFGAWLDTYAPASAVDADPSGRATTGSRAQFPGTA